MTDPVQADALAGAAFSLSPIGLVHVDRDLRILRINRALAALVGDAARTRVGARLDDLLDADPPLSMLLPAAAADADGVRAAAVTPDGRRRQVCVTCARLADATDLTTGHLVGIADVTDELATDRARRRMLRQLACLAAVGELQDDDLDAPGTLEEIARVVAAQMADWCVFAVPGDDGVLRSVAAAHRDAPRTPLVRALQDDHPSPVAARRGPQAVLRTGRSELHDDLTPELLAASADGDRHRELLAALDPRSAVIVPMTLHGAIVGTLMLVSSRPERRYDWYDVRTAEELGRRAALAMDASARRRAGDRALERAETTLEDERRHHRRLQATLNRRMMLQEVSTLLQDVLDPRPALTACADLLAPWVADHVRLVVRAPNLGVLEHGAGQEVAPAGADPPVRRTFAAGRHGTVVELTGSWWSTGGPDEDDSELLQDITDRLALACVVSELYADQVAMARTLQTSLLPAALPRVPGASIAARYLPAGTGAEVGGDFYDAFPLGDGTWMLAVGDVCGKGVEAAIVTARARHTLRAIALDIPAPAAALCVLNELLVRQRSDERFVTVGLLRFHPPADGRSRLEIACGGHPYPVLLRADGTGSAVVAPGQLIGVLPEVQITPAEVELHPGDVVAVFTDGVTEADPHRPLEAGGLAGPAAASVAGGPVAVAAAIERFARDRAVGGTLPDDVAILAVGLD